MSQAYQMPPFDYAKFRISDSSKKLYKYLLWSIFIALAVFVVALIAIFVFLIPEGFDLSNIDENNIYRLVENLFEAGIIIIVLLVIVGIALIVILIMMYIQYYKLGQGFDHLHRVDPISQSSKNASFGIYGYIIAIILGIFIPGIAGSVVSIIGTVSLAIGFYFVYQTFVDYKNQGRFTGSPTIMLFIAVAVNLVTTIVSMFTMFGSIGSIIGFILLLLGFRDLSKDINAVQPPTLPPGYAKEAPLAGVPMETHPAKPAPSEPIPKATDPHRPPEQATKFCSNCGAKISKDIKFCQNCGSSV